MKGRRSLRKPKASRRAGRYSRIRTADPARALIGAPETEAGSPVSSEVKIRGRRIPTVGEKMPGRKIPIPEAKMRGRKILIPEEKLCGWKMPRERIPAQRICAGIITGRRVRPEEKITGRRDLPEVRIIRGQSLREVNFRGLRPGRLHLRREILHRVPTGSMKCMMKKHIPESWTAERRPAVSWRLCLTDMVLSAVKTICPGKTMCMWHPARSAALG